MYQIEDEPGHLLEKPSVVTKKHPEGFRNGKYKLTVGQIEQHFLGELFSEQEGALLTAGRAKVEAFATEGTKVVLSATGIRASDSHYPLKVVPAGTKSSSDLLNPLYPVHTVPLGKLLLILRAKPIKVTFEDRLKLIFRPGNISILLGLRNRRNCECHIVLHKKRLGHDSLIAEKHGSIGNHVLDYYSEEIKKILAHPGCMAEQ